MQPRFAAKCALLIVLSAATFWATRSVVGQARNGRTRARMPRPFMRLISPAEATAFRGSNPAGHIETHSARINPNEPAPVPRHPGPGVNDASMTWKGLDVQVTGHDVQVMARAGIYESAPSFDYVWCLRLWSPGNRKDRKLIDEKYYDHQQFNLTWLQNVANPTFAEHLTLEPGQCKIEVKLFSFPHGFDRSKLTPGVDSRSSSGVSSWQDITIAD
jgi:hypothetical protein